MPNAAEAARQDIQQKAANKLTDRQGHDFGPLRVAVVRPAEAHLAFGEVNEPAVGERDPVGVCPPDKDVIVSAKYRCHWVGRRAGAKPPA